MSRYSSNFDLFGVDAGTTAHTYTPVFHHAARREITPLSFSVLQSLPVFLLGDQARRLTEQLLAGLSRD